MGVDGLMAAEHNGDNYALIGNVVLNARGRGLALGAAGLARGNTIAHPKYWGIQVWPQEIPGWVRRVKPGKTGMHKWWKARV